MGTEADTLALKLEGYVLQLREVEAALRIDPAHVDLIKVKADLNELIDLTKKILTEKLNAGITITRTEHSGSNAVPGSSRSRQFAANIKTEAIMLSLIKSFGDENYRDFIFKAFDETRSPEILRAIIKHLTNKGRKAIKRRWNGARKDMEDDDSDAGEANRCNGSAGPALSESSRSAWKKVRLKPTIHRDHKMVGAVICIVNSKKEIIFWSLIKWNDQDVCQTYPNLTGITRDKLELGLPLDSVLGLLQTVLTGNTLVGYKLEDDLDALSLSHDRKLDIAEYFQDEDGAFPLEDLKYLLDKAGGEVGNNKVVHEARTIRQLHLWMIQQQYDYGLFSNHPDSHKMRKMRKTFTYQEDGDSSFVSSSSGYLLLVTAITAQQKIQ
ncbi:Survival of motor neuron-related-splicing factor 30 [Orchesella cincta]|uniref:Survival of motor neuron-related-splicing factor 30 n=1 Tax=Orchesella cincta TaxID=48709 RepID=A0A1D2NBM3_ORCCI|nr:Survival of motor neuron-related-splicing factor 30 [Orchesella cincta]